MNMALNNMKLQENIHRIMGLMNESSTSHYRTYYDEDEVNRFEKILNKSMKKYDWWKDIPENIQEQETSRKDLSPMIEKLLERIKDNYPGIVCDIEVTAPWNREATEFDESFEDYEILITFVGGYGSNRWPNTQAISSQNEDVMNEVWDLSYNFLGLATDMYSKDNPRC